jgi:REP element-mobilizing transposase RayT
MNKPTPVGAPLVGAPSHVGAPNDHQQTGQPQGIAPTHVQTNLSKKHHRRSIRLKNYDYSQSGLYFITICAQNRCCLFGEIVDGAMILNDAGQMVHDQWAILPNRFNSIELHEFIVMPNHFHGIIELVSNHPVGAPLVGALSHVGAPNNHHQTGQPQGIAPTVTPTIGDIVGAFKSLTTNEYIAGVKQYHWPRFKQKLWQRDYYERIIRSEQSYLEIVEYIRNNPLNWAEDRYYAG